ncbi:protein kinase domain-containing protein [Streptomyces hygroscopicus]|uniref:protein kinase domain-containing protein n=1 Tax=Streptomyces hygroscopicus TaxID=1912 RepID=UPI00223F55BB|nr:protein kinase [Streptomyces hygroscopicus]
MGDGTTGESGAGLRTVGHGRYVLRQQLGQGGMASVHLAHDSVLERPVAVKTLHTDLGREASVRERFRREAQAVARLSHTNIVAVYDSGEDVGPDAGTVPYIVMEYVEGATLSSMLREEIDKHGAMPSDRALRITADVLSALAASHEQGLVHRDIKPGNVMVTPRGVVKVMDFGIARALQSGVTSMTQTGMVVGTPQYLSPEQALGKSIDARADLYSVGCMLFELLTGRPPFDGDTAFSLAYKHVQEKPPAPSSVNRAISPAVDALVAQALSKDPAHRFPTAEVMRGEVHRVLSGPPSGAKAAPNGASAGHDHPPAADRTPSAALEAASVPTVSDALPPAQSQNRHSSLSDRTVGRDMAPGVTPAKHPRRRRVVYAAGAAVVLAVVGTAAAQLLPDHSGPTKGSQSKASQERRIRASGGFTAASPWRLVVSDQIGGQDNGCTVTLTNTSTGQQNVLENYGTKSFLIHTSGPFRWAADNPGCEVVHRSGAGAAVPPFTREYGTGDTEAFTARGPIAVKVVDFNGAGDCRLDLRDAANGEAVDLGTATRGGGPLKLDPSGHPQVYLADLQCSVKVSAARG